MRCLLVRYTAVGHSFFSLTLLTATIGGGFLSVVMVVTARRCCNLSTQFIDDQKIDQISQLSHSRLALSRCHCDHYCFAPLTLLFPLALLLPLLSLHVLPRVHDHYCRLFYQSFECQLMYIMPLQEKTNNEKTTILTVTAVSVLARATFLVGLKRKGLRKPVTKIIKNIN